jgi:hypothetical protein
MPQKAAPAGPTARTRRCINRAKRTTRRDRSTPPRAGPIRVDLTGIVRHKTQHAVADIRQQTGSNQWL